MSRVMGDLHKDGPSFAPESGLGVPLMDSQACWDLLFCVTAQWAFDNSLFPLALKC